MIIKLIDVKANIYIWITLLFLTVFYSCDFGDNRLKIINNSNENIYVYYSCDSSLNDLQIFRNGYYKDNKGDSAYTMSDEYISKVSSHNIPRFGQNAWPRFIKDCNNKTMYIYFFSDSLVSKHNDYELKSQRLFTKYKSYSYDKLEKENWTIVYP